MRPRRPRQSQRGRAPRQLFVDIAITRYEVEENEEVPGEVETKVEKGKGTCDPIRSGKCTTSAGPGAKKRTWRGVWRVTDWFALCDSGDGCKKCLCKRRQKETSSRLEVDGWGGDLEGRS